MSSPTERVISPPLTKAKAFAAAMSTYDGSVATPTGTKPNKSSEFYVARLETVDLCVESTAKSQPHLLGYLGIKTCLKVQVLIPVTKDLKLRV